MKRPYGEDENALIVDEIQSLLQEKRTALKAVRIGIAVILAQISAVGYLVAAFRHHAFFQAKHGMDTLAALGVILLCIAFYMVGGSLIRIHRLDREILKFKRKRSEMTNLNN